MTHLKVQQNINWNNNLNGIKLKLTQHKRWQNPNCDKFPNCDNSNCENLKVWHNSKYDKTKHFTIQPGTNSKYDETWSVIKLNMWPIQIVTIPNRDKSHMWLNWNWDRTLLVKNFKLWQLKIWQNKNSN